MAPLLGGLLKAAASSFLGGQLRQAANEKVMSVVRDKLKLPEAAPTADMEAALAENPEAYSDIMEQVTSWRIEQERTHQVAIQEQGASERVAMQSDSRFVKWARPAMLYLGGITCFSLVMFGALIVWTRPDSLPWYVELVQAVSMPLMALLAAGGVYAYRRTTDKAIAKGILPEGLPFMRSAG